MYSKTPFDVVEQILLESDYSLENYASKEFVFKNKIDERFNYRFHIIGEVGLPYFRRYEGVLPKFYRKVDNSVINAHYGRVLAFNKDNEVKERSAHLMIREGLNKGQEYKLRVKAKIKGANDNFNLSAEVYYGAPKTRYYYEKPDEFVCIKLDNTDDFCIYEKEIVLTEDTDFVLLKLSAIDFTGEAEIFAPELINAVGENLSFPYDDCPENLDDFKWVAEGFSLIERPEFKILVNGKVIYNGRIMDALHRFSGLDFEVPFEVLKERDNEFTVECGNNVKPYTIRGARLLVTPKKFEMIAVKPTVRLNKEFGIFCYTDNAEISVKESEYYEYLGYSPAGNGFGVMKFVAKKCGVDVQIFATVLDEKRSIVIGEIIDKPEEFIITGTGDFIYVTQTVEEFSEYLSWYLNYGIGDLLTFRCVYHWGRAAEVNAEFWKVASKLLTDLGIYYSMMIDGRELNGVNAIPEPEEIESKYFLGLQTHERDGAFMYWTQDLNSMDELYFHLLSRKMKYNGNYGKRSPVYDKKGNPRMYYVADYATNVKEAYEYFRQNLKYTCGEGQTRHTGVTTKFHTFFEAGYKWVGYESMYGPHELLLGTMRATANSFGRPITGTHLAVQWSTAPSDDVKHFLRYRLSLYLSYMHGVSEVNTEEGLWRIENPFAEHDRYSFACTGHREEQSQFNKFINTHVRRGVQKPKIAIVMGKYDGFDCFSTPTVFGQEEWPQSTPEKSWDLVKTFYPDSDLNAIYYFIREGGDKDMPQHYKDLLEVREGLYRDVIDYRQVGFYTNTPYGVIDVLPIDSGNLDGYEFVFFAGWNTADEEQIKKLCNFVENGGTVMLGKVHLYDTVDRLSALSGKASVLNSPWVDKLLEFQNTGRVIYFDKDVYPIEYAEEYTAQLKKYAEQLKTPYISDCKYLSYTEYDVEDGSKVFYLLHINWWNNESAEYTLNIGGKQYFEKVTDNNLRVLTIKNNVAAYCLNKFIDLVKIDGETITLNGHGKTQLVVITQKGKFIKDVVVDGITNINILEAI